LNNLPKLSTCNCIALNCNPPDLSLPSSYNYRCKPQAACLSNALQHSRILLLTFNCMSQVARREEFECFQPKEMTNIWSNEYTDCPDLIITHGIHALKYHTVPHAWYNYHVNYKFIHTQIKLYLYHYIIYMLFIYYIYMYIYLIQFFFSADGIWAQVLRDWLWAIFSTKD
jgi:glycosyltransferase involved in cell wall biosynthesis